jgi:hypothetical protein
METHVKSSFVLIIAAAAGLLAVNYFVLGKIVSQNINFA